jgi:anti-sigma regulatory factor (Ser/Thr protein kinase)
MLEPLTLAGDLSVLPQIAQYVQTMAKMAGLTAAQSYNLRLAIDEVSTNIIQHGYQAAGRFGGLHFQTELTKASLTITVEDTGIAYNPEAYRHLTDDYCQQPLEQRQTGGLGVHLAIRSVDQFRYERLGDRNRTHFVIFLPAANSLA